MQGTSQLYQALLADPSSMVQWQAEIAGVIYSQDRIVSCSVSNQLFASKTLSVGSCCGAEIDLSIRNPGEIPRMAEIDLFARLSGKAGESEWIPKGVFYIDTREVDNRENSGNTNDIMTIHGYDAMLKAEQVYLQQGDVGTWPRAMTTVVNEICTRMGVELDSRTVLNGSYQVEYPNDYTMREVLGYIGAVNGGNWVITETGKLRLVRLNELPPETFLLVTENGSPIRFGEVRILVG